MAHGLVLRMQEMEQIRRNDRTPHNQSTANAESNENSSSNDVNLPKLWIDAVESPRNSKKEFVALLRKTLVFMLSSKWARYANKGDLLCAYKYHYRAFPTLTDNMSDIFKAVQEIFKRGPLSIPFFSWDDLFKGTLTIYDKKVQDYFQFEPEEVVLARVHALWQQERANDAMCLAKTSFLYHSRIVKSFRGANLKTSTSSRRIKGYTSIDWYFSILMRIKSLDFIVNEAKQLECHEGVEIMFRLWRDPKNKSICYALLQIFLLLDLTQTSNYCCTKRLLKLFCLMHEEIHSSPKEISKSCFELFTKHAPSSAHFYLFVDVLWRQFGMKCLELCIELFVRGLIADINHLEDKRHLKAFSDAVFLETHIARMFMKLSSLFKKFNTVVARECMFSAFSLRPTKEMLLILHELSQHLSNRNQDIHKSLLDFNFATDCNCGLRCIGHCREALNKSSFIHPLLSCRIGNISNVLKRDFISVLENVRCMTFQYNVFDWQYNIEDLDKYLRSFSQENDIMNGSDTESGDETDGSDIEDSAARFETANDLRCQFERSSIKRKSVSDCLNEINPQNIRENIAVQNDNFPSKRTKSDGPNVQISDLVSSSNPHPFDYLENFIRMQLDKPSKSESDSMNLLNVKSKPIVNDLKTSKRPDNSLMNSLDVRNHSNNQKCIETHAHLSYYSNKAHNQITTKLAYDLIQKQSVAVAPENHIHVKERNSSDHQIAFKSDLVQKPLTKVSNFTATQPVSETFSNISNSPKTDKYFNQVITNSQFTAKSEKERNVHNHHLHSSPFVSSQPPPKSFSKHQYKNHPVTEEKAQIVSAMRPQEARESMSCDNTRKSVIVNVKGKSLQIPNQLPVASKQRAMSQIQKDGSVLPLFHVPNKYLTKADVPVNTNVIIPYKHGNPASSSASQTFASDRKLVSLTSNMAPPSMIKNNQWNSSIPNKTLLPTKISSVTPSSSLPKKIQLFQQKPDGQLVLKRNTSNDNEFRISGLKPSKDFGEITKNGQHASISKGIVYSNSKQLGNSLYSKLKQTVEQVHDSPRSHMPFHPISDSHSAPVITSSQTSYASPYSKTSSNSPLSFHVQNMKTPQSPNSPVPFSVQDKKILESFGEKNISSYANANSHTYSSGNHVQNELGSSFLKSRLTSMHNTQTYPQMSVYSFSKLDSFSTQDKNNSESHEPFQRQINAKNISEKSAHSFLSSANVISVSQIQSNSSSVYNPTSHANDRRVIVHDARNIPTSTSNVQDTKSNAFSQQCCSPFEVNPCDTCSTKTSSRQFLPKTGAIGLTSAVESLHNQVTGVPENIQQQLETEEQKMCTFCAFAFPASLIKTHIEDAHREELFNNTNYKLQNHILSEETFSVSNEETVNITDYDSQNGKHMPLENSIHSTCNTVLDTENLDTENLDTEYQLISLLNFMGPSFDKSLEVPFENTANSHQISTNVTYDNSKSGSLSEMLKEVDFSKNISPDLSAICDENELSYDMIDNKEPCVENSNNENKDIKPWYNNINLDVLSSDDKPEKEKVNFINSKYQPLNSEPSSFEQNNNMMKIETNFVNKQTDENLRNSHDIFRTVAPLEQSNTLHSIQESDEIRNLLNTSSEQLKNNPSICPFCKKNIDNDIQGHMITFHPTLCGNKLVYDELISPNNFNTQDTNGQKSVFMPCSSNEQISTSEIFDFDSYSTDNTSKEIYKPLQKGKPKMYSSTSSCNSETSMNFQAKFDAQETELENPASKKKRPRETCVLCNKIYAKSYLKTHYRKEHTKDQPSGCLKMSEDSSNQSFSEHAAISSSTPEQNLSFPCISVPLLQEDIDTRTCLSTSDALISSNKFESSNIKKESLYDNSNITKQTEQKYLFHSISDGVEESTIRNSNFEGLGKPTLIVLKEKGINSKVQNSSNSKPNRTKRYRCNWSNQNQNCCLQNFSAKSLLLKHVKEEHISSYYKCYWFQDNNCCPQNFPLEYSLLKHIKSEHCFKKSDCNIQQSMTLNNPSAFDKTQLMRENSTFNNPTTNKEKVLSNDNLQKTQPNSDLLSMNLNHNFRKVQNSTNSVMQFNTNKAVLFPQVEHTLPSQNRDNRCYWYQNQNWCFENFTSMSLLYKHIRYKHVSRYMCNWFQEDNYCHQNFTSESLLLKHIRSEHCIKSPDCNIQRGQTQNYPSPFDKCQQMKENSVTKNPTDNKGSVLVHENLKETRVLKPNSDQPSMHLNHIGTVQNCMNSNMQLNSDKAVSFSRNEHPLPPEQVCPEDRNNQHYFEIPKKYDKCHLSPKSMSCLFSNTAVDETEVVSGEKMSSKQNDTSNSVSENCKKSCNKDELSDMLNNFKESTHDVNGNNLYQKIYERHDVFSYVTDVKEEPKNGDNLDQGSILNETPPVSYDSVTKDIGSGTNMLLLTSNKDSDVLQNFKEVDKISAGKDMLLRKESNMCEKSTAENVYENKTDSVPSKQAVTNNNCASSELQALQDNFKIPTTKPFCNADQTLISSIDSENVSKGEVNRPCDKESSEKASGEFLCNFEKPAVYLNNNTRVSDLGVLLSSLPSINSNSQNAHYSIPVQDCRINENDDSVVSCAEKFQNNNQLNLTKSARVVNNLPENKQYGANAVNFSVTSQENCTDSLIGLKTDSSFQSQQEEAYKLHESISPNSLIAEKQNIESNGSGSPISRISTSPPSVSESDEKDMPILAPEFDFQPLLVNEKFKTDENTQGSEEDLKKSDFYCYPNEIHSTTDENVVKVFSAGACNVNNQKSICISSSISSNSSFSCPEALACRDSKDSENLSLLNEECSVFSSVDTLQDLSISELGLLESVMQSKSNILSAEHLNDSSCNQKDVSDSKSETWNYFPVNDFGKKIISCDEDAIDSCSKLVNSEKTVGNKLSNMKHFEKSLPLLSDVNSLKENIVFESKMHDSILQRQLSIEHEIKIIVNDMMTFISNCDDSRLLNFENYKKNTCVKNKTISTVPEVETSPDSTMSMNSNCVENNLRKQELSYKKQFAAPTIISVKRFCTSDTKPVKKPALVCSLCDEVFKSNSILSDHLKEIHDVLPHLKRQISKSRKRSDVENDKLSPPKLYPHSTCDSDSESVSAESSPNKHSEEDNYKNNKNMAPEAPSSESSSVLESSSSTDLEQLKFIKSPRKDKNFLQAKQKKLFVSRISSKYRKRANNMKIKYQNKKNNKMGASVCPVSLEDISTSNVVCDPLNKDKIEALPKIKILKDGPNSFCVKSEQTECNSVDNLKYLDTNSTAIVVNNHSDDSSSSIECLFVKECQKLKKRPRRRFCPRSSDGRFDSNLFTKGKANKKTNINYATLKSKGIKQFLLDNKQPYVLTTRLNKSLLNSPNISTSKPDFSYRNFICKRSVVRLRRLNCMDLLKNNVRLSDISVVLQNVSEGKTFETSELPDVDEKEKTKNSPEIPLRDCRVVLERLEA